MVAKFTIIFEKANANYSAYCLDLPGCIGTGKTEQDTFETMKEAIRFHLEGLKHCHISRLET